MPVPRSPGAGAGAPAGAGLTPGVGQKRTFEDFILVLPLTRQVRNCIETVIYKYIKPGYSLLAPFSTPGFRTTW
eukprot:COSAG04_NODE_1547_length_6397_cov_31.714513_3_plen_74_part_00